jgi:hypothetical protein
VTGQRPRLRVEPHDPLAVEHEVQVVGEVRDLVQRRDLLLLLRDPRERDRVLPLGVQHEQGAAVGRLVAAVLGDAGRVVDGQVDRAVRVAEPQWVGLVLLRVDREHGRRRRVARALRSGGAGAEAANDGGGDRRGE